MSDYPRLSRIAGGWVDLPEAAFDAGEVTGMRTAGIILLSMATANVAAWLIANVGVPLEILIDVFLGVQLFRLRHSWRSWALVRAWIGIVLGCVIVAAQFVIETGTSAIGLAGLGQLAFSSSLLLLLHGRPSASRVLLGRVVFACSLVPIGASVMLVRDLFA
jgi:hypothetical protein